MIGYIGSYASKDSTSVVRFIFDEQTETFTEIKNILPWKDSKYLSILGKDFVSILKQDKAGIGLWHMDSNECEEVLDEDITACYVTQDDAYIYTANYHEGTLSIYAKKDHLHLQKRILIQKHAGCHQVILYKQYLLVPCLLLDKVMVFDRLQDDRLVKEIAFPKGSGPRHGVIDAHDYLYLVSELSNQLFIFHLDEELHVELVSTMDLIPENEKGAAAAIRMSKDERFLYISIRDINQILVYDIQQGAIIQRLDACGEHPRDIALSLDDAYLFIANRFTNALVVCKRDKESGLLTPCFKEMKAVEAVSIVFEEQEAAV